MRVKMLWDAPGSPDGIHVYRYENGKLYDVTDSLGNAFIESGAAKVDKGKSEPEPDPGEQE